MIGSVYQVSFPGVKSTDIDTIVQKTYDDLKKKNYTYIEVEKNDMSEEKKKDFHTNYQKNREKAHQNS